jgi:hypothetical protein
VRLSAALESGRRAHQQTRPGRRVDVRRSTNVR